MYWPTTALRAVQSLKWESDVEPLMRDLEQRFQQAVAPIPAPTYPAPVDDPGGSGFRSLDEQTSGWQEVPDDYQPGQASQAQTAPALAPLDQMTAHWGPKPQPAAASAPTGAPSAALAPGVPSPELSPNGTPVVSPGEMAPAVAAARASVPAGPPAEPGSRRSHAQAMAEKYGLDWGVFDRQLNQESGYQDNAVSSAGARGPGQFMPETGARVARQMGLTPEQFWASPEAQIEGAALHMRDLLAANRGDYRMALAAYNAGQGNVDKYGEGVFGDDFAAGQTRDYVDIILGPGAAGRSAPNAPAGAPPAGAASPPAPAAPAPPLPAPAAAGAPPDADMVTVRDTKSQNRQRVPRSKLPQWLGPGSPWVVEEGAPQAQMGALDAARASTSGTDDTMARLPLPQRPAEVTPEAPVYGTPGLGDQGGYTDPWNILRPQYPAPPFENIPDRDGQMLRAPLDPSDMPLDDGAAPPMPPVRDDWRETEAEAPPFDPSEGGVRSPAPAIPGPDLSPMGTPIVDQPPTYGPPLSEAGPATPPSPFKPLYDAAGAIVGYVQSEVARASEPPSDEQRAQNASVAGLTPDQTLTGQPTVTPIRTNTRPTVEALPGEPDYVPPTPSLSAPGGLLEPAGGAPRLHDRMMQIRQLAASELGRNPIDQRVTSDPGWRARNPALADEYDALEQQLGLTIIGQAGDAARVARSAPALRAAAEAGQGAVQQAPTPRAVPDDGTQMLGSGVVPSGPGALEPWRMTPDEWQSEMARVSPDGRMPDPSVDRAAYQRWYELEGNKPVGATPTLQTGPFEADPRLRPAIESSYLRSDDYRFVRDVRVEPRSTLVSEAQYRQRAGIGGGETPRAKFERDGRMTFQGEILDDPRAGRTMTHEVGHSIENNLPERLLERWKRDIHPDTSDSFEYGRFLQEGGEAPPTSYAGQNWAEDFAETFTEWRQAQVEGRAPNLGPLRQQFMRDVDAWLSGGARGGSDGEQLQLLSGAAPSAPRPGLPPLRADAFNAAQGGVLGAVSEDLQAQSEGRESDPSERVRRALGAGALAVAGGRAARRGPAGTRSLGSGVVPEPNQRPTPAIEQAIRSDYGRRIQNVRPMTESAEDLADAKFPREAVHPDIRGDVSGPVGVPTFMAGRQNAAIPFDPASAAAGGAAGAMSADEEGEQGDPGRTAAGMAVAGILGRKGRNAAGGLKAPVAAAAQATKPPNALETAQAFRYSWGMLGNPATGLLNAVSGPSEIALGLPVATIKTGLLEGRPLPVVYQAAELTKGLAEGVVNMLGTVVGIIPKAVRESPDYRPPMAERMQGPVGKAVGYAIDTPGRITSQAPDALFSRAFERWGRAQVISDMLDEMGVSQLRPDQQAAEITRLAKNPTPEEAARINEGGRQIARAMTYRAEPGKVEQHVSRLFRPGERPATSDDPVTTQIADAAGSFLQPFFTAVWQFNKRGMTFVPGLGSAIDTKVPFKTQAARQAVGAGLVIWAADRASQGIVTGPGPSDPDEAALLRAQGVEPNSVLIPPLGYVPIDAFGPAAPILRGVGAYYDSLRYATDQEQIDRNKMGERVVKDQLRAYNRFPVVQAMQAVFKMAESPVEGVTDFAASVGSSFVPAAVKAKALADDPFNRTTDREVPPVERLRQKLVQRSGDLSAVGLGSRQDLPVAQDRFGRPVENPRQGMRAITPRTIQPKDDPLARVFGDAKVEPGLPPKTVTVSTYGADGKVAQSIPMRLTDAEQREWNRLRGEALQGLAGNLAADPAWAATPRTEQERYLKLQMDVANAYASRKIRESLPDDEVRRRTAPLREVRAR